MPTPPPSPLTSLSPPSALGLTFVQALIDAVTAALPSPPLLPPLYIPPPVNRRDDVPETERPPRKRSCLFALGFRYEIGESSTTRLTGSRRIDYGFVSTLDAEVRRQGIGEVGYGIRDTWVDPAKAVPEIAPMTLEELLPPVDSPIAESLGYVAESDPEEDPKEYGDDETDDGPVDYPIDEGDDDEGDSSGDDADDEDEDEDDKEEEHLALADSAVVIPTVEIFYLPEGTEPVIPPPSTDTTTTGARITVRLYASIPLPPEAEVERLLAMPTPPPSPLTSLSPPSVREHLA
nr:hypothetical protein [Tanacetum cinerariifolium]